MATILTKSEYITLKQRLKRKYRRMYEEELDNYTCKDILRKEANLDPIEDRLPSCDDDDDKVDDISNLSDDDFYDIVCCKHKKQLLSRKRATKVVKTNYHTGKLAAYKSHKVWLWNTFSSRAYVEYKKYCEEHEIAKKSWVEVLKVIGPDWKNLKSEEAEAKIESTEPLFDWEAVISKF